MSYPRTLHISVVVVAVVLLSFDNSFSSAQQNRMIRPIQQPFGPNRIPPVMCGTDTIMFYQDCRMCVCPRPNRVAKCFRKSCDLRTKDGGQCPTAVLRMDDSRACSVVQVPTCKVDADCPGGQMCCFDFCGGAKCVNPVPLDMISGTPVHKGRGYQ